MASEAYTKAVMEHFLHPKNFGEIDNADVVGEAGNAKCGDMMFLYIKLKGEKISDIKFKTLGCLPEYEKVLNPDFEWKDINLYSKGEFVLNSLGEKTKIESVYKQKFRGHLLRIVPFVSTFNSFEVTSGHPILSIKRRWLKHSKKSSNSCKWLRVRLDELKETKPSFIEAELLEKGDYLCFTKIKTIKDSEEYGTSLMRLVGYYLSEGYATANDSVLNFSFHRNEIEEISEVKKLSKEIIGKEGSHRTRGNVTELRICSRKWCRFFIEKCGKYAKHKKLSNEILFLPPEKQMEMLRTFIKGDGNTYRRRENDSETYRMDTSSISLAIQFQEILVRNNIFPSLKKFERKATIIEGRHVGPHTLYNLSFKIKKNKEAYVKSNKYFFFVPIRHIQEIKYSGEIFNLEVSGEDKSFLTRGFAVHNCAAAIATSDILCDMAKGKTLSEAGKINNNDIVKGLNGLPTEKLHCSVLAAAALKDAIKKYNEKKK